MMETSPSPISVSLFRIPESDGRVFRKQALKFRSLSIPSSVPIHELAVRNDSFLCLNRYAPRESRNAAAVSLRSEEVFLS